MIIVNQNKTGLVNFDNVTSLYVDEQDDGSAIIVIRDSIASGKLAIYETTERAKEVLKEIIEAFFNWETVLKGKCSPVYYMP